MISIDTYYYLVCELNSDFASFPRGPFSFPGSHPGSHFTCDGPACLVSFHLKHFFGF